METSYTKSRSIPYLAVQYELLIDVAREIEHQLAGGIGTAPSWRGSEQQLRILEWLYRNHTMDERRRIVMHYAMFGI